MNSLQLARSLVNDMLDTFGVDSYNSRIDQNSWRVAYGSSSGIIGIIPNDEDLDRSTIYVAMRVMKVPVTRALPFYRRVLEINDGLLGKASFSVDRENTVWFSAGRNVGGLDADEIASLIYITSGLADSYDDELLDEFGREYALND